MSKPTPSARAWFRTLKEVRTYLEGRGFRVAGRTLRQHRQDQKLKPTARGVFARSAVDAYARSFLTLAEAGTTPEQADLQERKARADATYLLESTRTSALKRLRDAGDLIPRAALDRLVASRGAVLKTVLVNDSIYHMPEILETIHADRRRAPEVLEALEDLFLNALDRTRHVSWVAVQGKNKTFTGTIHWKRRRKN